MLNVPGPTRGKGPPTGIRKKAFLLEFPSVNIRKSYLAAGVQGLGQTKCSLPPLGEDPLQIGNDFVAKCPLSDGIHIPLNQTNIKCFQASASDFLLLFHRTPESFKMAI